MSNHAETRSTKIAMREECNRFLDRLSDLILDELTITEFPNIGRVFASVRCFDKDLDITEYEEGED